MIINCPKCKSELDLPDDAAGYRVECDCCGQKFEARDAVFDKGMEYCAEAEKAQSAGQGGNATANWAVAHSYFKAAAEAGHPDSLFMSGVSEIASSQKFQNEMSDAPQSAKSAVALLFWYWKNGKQLDADTKQRYATFRSAREEQLDDASLNFLVSEYESMNSAADVERLKAILENRRAAAAAAAAKEASVLSQYVVPDRNARAR